MKNVRLAALFATVMMGMMSCSGTPVYAQENRTSMTVEKEASETETEPEAESSQDEPDILSSVPLDPSVLARLTAGMDPDIVEVLLENPKLMALLMPTLHVTVTDSTVKIAFKEQEPAETVMIGTVRTNGGNLNVRAGASISSAVISHLKNGNYFYMVIDRNDKGEENVHLLNLVDERDLMDLMAKDDKGTYEAITEAEKAAAEAAAQAEKEAAEKAAAEAKEKEKAEKESKKPGSMASLLLLPVILAAAVGAWFFLQTKKKKKETASPDPDAGYEEDEDDDGEDYAAGDEAEDEEDKPESDEESEGRDAPEDSDDPEEI